MIEKFDNKNMTELDENEKDLFLQIDFLQEKLVKFEDNEAEVLKMTEKLEEEVMKRKNILEEIDFYKQSTIDLINQMNHVQNLLLKKIKDYDSLKLENNYLVKEVSMIYDNLDKYKILSVEQNKEILRAIKLIKKKKT